MNKERKAGQKNIIAAQSLQMLLFFPFTLILNNVTNLWKFKILRYGAQGSLTGNV